VVVDGDVKCYRAVVVVLELGGGDQRQREAKGAEDVSDQEGRKAGTIEEEEEERNGGQREGEQEGEEGKVNDKVSVFQREEAAKKGAGRAEGCTQGTLYGDTGKELEELEELAELEEEVVSGKSSDGIRGTRAAMCQDRDGNADVAAMKQMIQELATANRRLADRVGELEECRLDRTASVASGKPADKVQQETVAGPKVTALKVQKKQRPALMRSFSKLVIPKSPSKAEPVGPISPTSPSASSSTPVKGGWWGR
jgi:hypothetical protein